MSFARQQTVTDLASGEDRRVRRNRIRKGNHALAMSEKREEWAKKEKAAAFFTREEHTKLASALVRLSGVLPEASAAYAALTMTVPTKRSGFIAVCPDAERAATLARLMRGPGINAFSHTLVRLDEISGRARPAGKAVDIYPTLFVSLLTELEKIEAAGGGDSARAARAMATLREATEYRGLIRTFVTSANAGDLGDALHAIGAPRIVVNEIDTIAGRSGFRQ